MVIELTDGEYDLITTTLDDGVEFEAVLNTLMGQFAIALQLHLQESDFRICQRCDKWRYTWRFNEAGNIDDNDEKAYGEWLCYDELTPEQRIVVDEWNAAQGMASR